ncbi:MAG: pyridoxal-phosphate dependent enzyme, partial [Victivallales bacterium]|nr:pyridoxal-phosphate dependent enzyme [Victivallales bacterium]
TGGTFTGTARYLREKNPALGAYAVEPAESPLLSGGQAAPHRIQGIGANFIPKVMDASLATEILTVNADDAGECARRCAASEGILIGISGGAALHAAIRLAERPEFQGKTIVVILPDCGERYLSTWLFDNGK